MMNKEQIIVAYANLSVGTETDLHRWLYLHNILKCQGYVHQIDVNLIISMGWPITETWEIVFNKKISNTNITITFDDYLKCLDNAAGGDHGRFCNLASRLI